MSKLKIAKAVLILNMTILSTALNADETKGLLKNEKQRLGYAIGQNIAKNLKPIKKELDLKSLSRGISDMMLDNPSLMTQPEMQQAFKSLQIKQAAKNKVKGSENSKKGVAFLEANKKKPGVKSTASGLQYLVLKNGTGAKPKATDTVKVHYRGTLINGTEFDSSFKRKNPVTFPLNRVIKGWSEGLQLMSVGSKYRLFVPAKLGYGLRGMPPKIGPNATLIFEVELLSIESK